MPQQIHMTKSVELSCIIYYKETKTRATHLLDKFTLVETFPQ